MATKLEELIQFWKDELAGPPGQHSPYRLEKIREAIWALEELKRLKES